MIWLTADTHWGHANIIKYCSRPFYNVAHMDLELTRRWNETVRRQDIVMHLGDFGFCKTPPKLNGKIFLLPGNHDRKCIVRKWVGNGFLAGIIAPNDKLAEGVHMYHKPHLELPGRQVCGHVHEKFKLLDNRILNVGVDVWDYRPVSIDTVLAQFPEPGVPLLQRIRGLLQSLTEINRLTK